MSIELPAGFQVVQRVFLVDPNGVEMLLRTDMRIGTGISLASGFCPPASGGGGDIEVWTGGTRPGDIVLNGADVPFDQDLFVGVAVALAPGDASAPEISLGFVTASEQNQLQLSLDGSGATWLLSYNYNEEVFVFDQETGLSVSNSLALGILRCTDGFRIYIYDGGAYSTLIACTPTPESGSQMQLTSGNAGLVLADQEWFTGTPTADAYPASNLVSAWVADNSGA